MSFLHFLLKNNDVFKKLRGPRGTKVKVGIQRKGNKDLLVYEITRDKIPIYSIDASFMVDDEVGYIKVSRFAKTTPEELTKALKKLKYQGMKDTMKIVLNK